MTDEPTIDPLPEEPILDPPPSAGGRERVPDRVAEAIKAGIRIEMVDGPLRTSGRRAAYFSSHVDGEPGVIVIGTDAELGDVEHEIHHFEQMRIRGFPAVITPLEVAEYELATYEYQMASAPEWGGYSAEHLEDLRRLRDYYYNEIDRLKAHEHESQIGQS